MKKRIFIWLVILILYDIAFSLFMERGVLEFDLAYLIIYILLIIVFIINTIKISKSEVKNKFLWIIISLVGIIYPFLFVFGYIPSLKEYITPY